MESPYSEAADILSPTDLEFGSLANSLSLLLEAAKSELEHDKEAAKTSLATASSILQSEMERRSGPRGKELTPFFWTEVALLPGASEPANSRFFKASEIAGGLPDLQFIKGHLDVASRAIDACRDPRQAIENLVRLLH